MNHTIGPTSISVSPHNELKYFLHIPSATHPPGSYFSATFCSIRGKRLAPITTTTTTKSSPLLSFMRRNRYGKETYRLMIYFVTFILHNEASNDVVACMKIYAYNSESCFVIWSKKLSEDAIGSSLESRAPAHCAEWRHHQRHVHALRTHTFFYRCVRYENNIYTFHASV